MGALLSWITGNRLDGESKVVLVTGAGSGLGAALSRYLIENGDSVILADVNTKAIEDLKNELNEIAKRKGHSNKAYALTMNVSSEESVKNAAADVIKMLPPVNMLSNTTSVSSQPGLIDAIVNFAGLLSKFIMLLAITSLLAYTSVSLIH